MAVVAVPLLAVLILHATTFEVGVLAAAGYLPWLLIGLPAGAWADKLPPRALMIVCDLCSAFLYASVPVALWLHVLAIWQLAVVQLLAGGANVLFGTAYQVNLTSLVAPEELVEGNAKLQGSAYAAVLGGRSLAGVVTESLGAATALLCNAISFLVSAWCLMSIRATAPQRGEPRGRTTIRGDIAAGLRLVFGDPYLRRLSLFGALANFALDGYLTVLVVFLVRVAGLSAAVIGLLLAVPGLGGLLGSLVARRVSARLGTARSLLAGTIGVAPFTLLIPLTAAGPRLAFYVVGVLATVTGISVANIIMATFRQTYCPPEVLGRVTATMRFMTQGVAPFGALAGGALGTWLGLRGAMWVTLVIVALSGLILLSRPFLRSRDLPPGRAGAAAVPAAEAAA
jgi:predicted MFS family arabinose efflux permease